jgi:predicted transcriptional regulator
MVERTTVRLPPDLVRRAKHKATEQGRSLTALIEEGLRRVVDDSPAARSSVRIVPGVSAAKRGLMPGVDLDDSVWRESEDLEYIRRLF